MLPEENLLPSPDPIIPPQSSISPTPNLPLPENNKVSFDTPQNWGGGNSLSSPSPVSSPPLPTASEPQETSSPSFLKVFLISISLVLLGILLGILAAKFFQPKSSTPADLMVEDTTQEPLAGDLTNEASPTPIIDPMSDWQIYKDTKNKLEFLYPKTLTTTTTEDKNTPDTLNISIVSGTLESTIKKNEFSLASMENVSSAEPEKIFKKATREANTNVLVGFFSLSKTKTLVLTRYLNGSVQDEVVNKEFNQILSSFKILTATPSATPAATESAIFKTPAS